jgi:hypothetical protein
MNVFSLKRTYALFAALSALTPFTAMAGGTAAPIEEKSFGEINDKLTFSGQVRIRPEFRHNLSLVVPATPSAIDEDFSVLLRSRFGLKFAPIDGLSFFVQGQDAREFAEETTAAATTLGDDEGFDLHQGYVDYTQIGGSHFSIRLGRQEISFGDSRLVGNGEWTNFGRAFDAGLFTFDNDNFKVDLLAAMTNKTAGAGDTQYFGGLYGTWKKFPGGTLDAYYLLLQDNDGAAGALAGTGNTLSVHTIGTRLAAKHGKVDYNVEGAVQVGKFGSNKILAYAGHGNLGFTFEDDLKPRLAVEYNYASGEDGGAGTYTKFNNLFGTEHNKYGLMDIAVWSNMHDGAMLFSIKPGKFVIGAEYHLLMVAQPTSTTDTFGGVAGAAGVGRLAGHEADLTVAYNWNKYANFLLGWSHFLPGAFFKDQGINAQADFAYFQATAQF